MIAHLATGMTYSYQANTIMTKVEHAGYRSSLIAHLATSMILRLVEHNYN